MKSIAIKSILLSLFVPAFSWAGGVFGILHLGDAPAPEGTEIRIEIGDQKYTAKTDASGRYKITTAATGKAKVFVQNASAELTIFGDPVQYNLQLKDGKLKIQ
jgi:hypothetical protein